MTRYCFTLLVVTLFPVSLAAQESTGTIIGRVFDSSGAAIAGADVTAIQIDTGRSRKAKSGSDGSYAIVNLPIGPYEVTATHSGFKKAIQTGLMLHVSEHLGHNIAMQVGDMTQEISVTSAADAVQTLSAEQGRLISGEQVRDLQFNGRSFFTLLELTPGVTSNLADRTDPNSTPDVNINGARSSASNISIDGGNNADVIVGSSSMNTFTSIDTIAEFKIVTTPYSAEYGRGGFSQINVVTKGGTKNFHGTLFHFLRNDAIDANDYFSHQTLPLKLNNFGYNIGGPVSLPGYNRAAARRSSSSRRSSTASSPRAKRRTSASPDWPSATAISADSGAGRDDNFETSDDPVVDPINNNSVSPAAKFPRRASTPTPAS